MSAKWTFWAWDQEIKSAPKKLALLKLADNANDGGKSWYSIAKMAKSCGVSERTFIRSLQELEKINLLRIEKRPNRPSVYTLTDGMEVTLGAFVSDSVSPLANPVSDRVSPVSDRVSPLGVTECHTILTTNPKRDPNNIVECEFEMIKNLYNAVVDNIKPNWSKLTIINDKRKGKIKKLVTFSKQRIKQSDDISEKPIEYIKRLLSALATDEFYSGRSVSAQYPNGYKWDFEGITSETHIIKFIERETT